MTACAALAAQLTNLAMERIDIEWGDVLDQVRMDRHLVRSTRHPLGFLHSDLTPLAGLNEGAYLRLHYWPSAGSSADSIGSMHDHVWALTSVVAAGQLRDHTFVPVRRENGEFEGTRVVYGENSNEFVGDGYYSLELDRELVVNEGAVYRIPSRTVHDSFVLEAPAVTFVLAQDDSRASIDGPLILQRRGSTGVGTTVRESVDTMTVVSLVSERLGIL